MLGLPFGNAAGRAAGGWQEGGFRRCTSPGTRRPSGRRPDGGDTGLPTMALTVGIYSHGLELMTTYNPHAVMSVKKLL
jgi:hypothetical protein